jgi:hypothetical protein
MPCTTARPKLLPSPGAFAVMDGSKIRRSVADAAFHLACG